MADKTLHGTRVLDLKTIETSPNFFAIQALMLRAAGMDVHVLEEASTKYEVGFRAARLKIPFTEAAYYTAADQPQRWKYEYVMALLKKGPVLWPDIDFGSWQSEPVDNVPGLTIFSWARVLKDGIPGAATAMA